MYSRIMLSPPQNMTPYLGHYAPIMRACSLLRVLLRFLINTANLRTNIMDFRGFHSSLIFILRDGIPRPIGDFPES